MKLAKSSLITRSKLKLQHLGLDTSVKIVEGNGYVWDLYLTPCGCPPSWVPDPAEPAGCGSRPLAVGSSRAEVTPRSCSSFPATRTWELLALAKPTASSASFPPSKVTVRAGNKSLHYEHMVALEELHSSCSCISSLAASLASTLVMQPRGSFCS